MRLVVYIIHTRVSIAASYTTETRGEEMVLESTRPTGAMRLPRAARERGEILALHYISKRVGKPCLGEPVVHQRYFLPRHNIAHEVGILLRRCLRRSRCGLHNHRLEAVVYSLARRVADAMDVPIVLLWAC